MGAILPTLASVKVFISRPNRQLLSMGRVRARYLPGRKLSIAYVVSDPLSGIAPGCQEEMSSVLCCRHQIEPISCLIGRPADSDPDRGSYCQTHLHLYNTPEGILHDIDLNEPPPPDIRSYRGQAGVSVDTTYGLV